MRHAADALLLRASRVPISLASFQNRAQPVDARSGGVIRPGSKTHHLIKTMEESRMTYHVSRRSLLALGAGLGATAITGGSAVARAPKLGTQPSYFYRFN